MTFLEHLRDGEPQVAVELRPPRSDLGAHATMDSWFAMNAAIRRVATPGRVVFLTDNAVGSPEEENLHHLVTNLEDGVSRDLMCPFLTTKHEQEYCDWFAARAAEAAFPALVVLGGDRHVGPPRCVPHGYVLRQRIRARFPDLVLGGWANPHADAAHQVRLVNGEDFCAEFCLTQIVSHYDPAPVDRFLAEAARQGATLPTVFGVFFWRSARARTLDFLSRFFPVPAEGVTRDLEAGVPPAEICARSIRALRERGIRHVYVSNLGPNEAADTLADVEARL